MNIQGNTVLITGGGSGIGLALARALLARGSAVLACGRSSDRLDRAGSELLGLQTFACDITDERDRDGLCSWVREHVPSLNVLINNAGIARQMDVMDFAADGADGTAVEVEVATNLLAPIHLTFGLLPILRERTSAAIVNVTSALAYAPIASLPVYSATKAALRSFTQSLRHRLAGTAVRVIEVVPAVVDTPMQQRRLDVPKLAPGQLAGRVLARMAVGTRTSTWARRGRSGLVRDSCRRRCSGCSTEPTSAPAQSVAWAGERRPVRPIERGETDRQ